MSVVEIIRHYQRSLDKCVGDLARTLHCVSKLYNLPITVQHLQETGVGKTVNALRKYEGDCGEAAKACVAKWKAMVAAEESSDPETCEVPPAPGDLEDSPTDIPIKEKPRTTEKVRSKSHREEPNNKRVKEERSGSNGSHKNHNDLSKSKNRKEESTNKIRDNSRDNYDHVKRQRDKLASAAASCSSSDERPSINSKSSKAEQSSVKINGNMKHREKSTHSSSRSMSTDRERKVESTKSRDDKSSGKDRHGDKNKSSKSEEHAKQKRREEHLVHVAKERSRAKVSGSGESTDETPEKIARHIQKYTQEASRLKSEERKSDSSNCNGGSRHREKVKRRDSDKMTAIRTADGSIDCLSGASFAEALGMVNPVRRSSPGSTSRQSPSKPRQSSSPVKHKSSSSAAGSSRKYADSSPADFDLLSPSTNLEPLDISLGASIELPPINPHYRPLPNAYNPFDSPPPSKKMKSVTDEERLAELMYHKAERTRVYSGVKGSRRGQPATLFDSCVRVLQDNIEALGYTGGVPYSILKPVLDRATAEQLLELEHYNPYLVEDSDELWEYHAKKQFRMLERQEMESYRELFMRGLDERAAKLEALKSNIKQSQATSVPVRQAKMTYMDSAAKPPREVARQQARNGTARPVPRGVPGPSSSPGSSRGSSFTTKQKPRVAPLMQKAMKFAKTFKR